MDESDAAIIFVMVIFGILIFASAWAGSDPALKNLNLPKDKCPPHAWNWEDKVNEPGKVQIRCKACRMVPSLSTRDDHKPY